MIHNPNPNPNPSPNNPNPYPNPNPEGGFVRPLPLRLPLTLSREGVQLFPWRYDAAAADLQPDDMPSAAELEQLTVKVEALLASRDECLLRDSPHAALLDRRAR